MVWANMPDVTIDWQIALTDGVLQYGVMTSMAMASPAAFGGLG